MRIRLSNYGHRYTDVRVNSPSFQGPEMRVLEHLLNRLLLPYTESAIERQLLERGLIELVPEDASTADMALRYARNPLENIDLVNFEMTTRCDLHCLHCRTLSHMTEERRREITQQAEAFITRLESQYA